MTRRFRIAVLQCSSLAKADLSGYNDPFVSLQVDHLEEVRTATIDQGGVAPVWGGGGGETLLFDELTAPPAMVEVKVWDEDPGGHSADDLIGSHQLDLDGELEIAPDHDWSHTAWLPLVNQKGKPAGEVLMALRWDATELIDGSLPPPECSPKWHLTVKLQKCTGLPSMDVHDLNDPYVELSVDGAKERLYRHELHVSIGKNQSS